MFMCLHAWCYDLGEGKTFRTEMPRWVQDRSVLEPVFKKRKAAVNKVSNESS